jgi:hypothetical protein
MNTEITNNCNMANIHAIAKKLAGGFGEIDRIVNSNVRRLITPPWESDPQIRAEFFNQPSRNERIAQNAEPNAKKFI